MQVPSVWEIPPDLRASVADRVGRQRALISGEHLLLVLHKVPRPGTPERKGALFWRGPDGKWLANEAGDGLKVLRNHIEAYASAVDAQEADFECADSAIGYHEIQQAISPLHRAGSHMHGVLQTAREAIKEDTKLGSMADWAYDVSRAADLLHTDARNAMDYELARQTSMQAEVGRRIALVANRLNVLAALFLPLMAFASVFGMNLSSGLDHDEPGTFWGILVAGVALGLVVCLVAFRAGRIPVPNRKHGKKHWKSSEKRR